MTPLSASRVFSEELLQVQNEKKGELDQFRKQMEQRVESLQQEKSALSREVTQLKFWNEFLDPLLLCVCSGIMIGLSCAGMAVW